MELIKPPALQQGGTIGIFAPSFPAHIILREKYLVGVQNLQKLGFVVKEGFLVKNMSSQGYRTASGQERAAEFMELIMDKNVGCIMSVIGGNNSSSLLEYLNYDVIRSNPKIICGFSDVTSLHLAILACAGIKCFYGPAVVPSFGEPGDGFIYTNEHFIQSVNGNQPIPWVLIPPTNWSNHFIDATKENWANVKREYNKHGGWKTIVAGTAEAPLLPANLDTLVSVAGTKYFPELEGCILLIEEMHADFDNFERNLAQLKLMGIFNKICGLILSKPEKINTKGASFSVEELLMEFVGANPPYPVITGFDCGHTYPMITLQQMVRVRIETISTTVSRIEILESMIADTD